MFWHRLAIAGAVVLVTLVIAKLVDSALGRRELAPDAYTRYRVLRRTVMSSIVIVGVFSALLVIPQVRAIAGGILASSAVLGLVIGFAAQRTIGNVVAGVLIAFSQPLRLGDTVTIDGTSGVVEEIGLTYTFIRAADGVRLVIPNEKLASDTILNSTIRSTQTVAEVTVQVPLSQDLDAIVAALRDETEGGVYVKSIDGNATIVVREDAQTRGAADEREHELLLAAHRRLRELGVWS